MRKMCCSLMVALFLLGLVPQTCFAIMYANADANYPIWNTGNRGGSALDLSSAVITEENEYEMAICALNYTLTYTGGDGRTHENGTLEPRGYVYFTTNYRTGKAWVIATPMHQPMTIIPNSPESEALELVKRQVGIQ